jgi:hypothetical protein
MRPLQALGFRIEQAERTSGVTAVAQNSYRRAARHFIPNRSPRGKSCLMDGRNCTYTGVSFSRFQFAFPHILFWTSTKGCLSVLRVSTRLIGKHG